MASPVDTSVKHFLSDMAGAPVLSGTAGAMIGVLDACLVNGFDLKTLTSLVVSGGVATATWTGTHSATPDSVVLVANVTGALTELNGEQKVLSKTATTLTFATAAADGTAAGTITIKMAPAGWEKVYSGTNKAVYRSLDVTGTRMYLRVDDTGTTTCRVVGYESMSDVDTGAGQFPTNAQMSGGGYWIKSSAANSTANKWALAADSRMFYYHPMPYSGAFATMLNGITRGFGDPIPLKPGGDAYCCTLNYGTVSAVTDSTGSFDYSASGVLTSAFPRNANGLGSSALHTQASYTGSQSAQISGLDTYLGPFPSSIDGSLILSAKYLAFGLNNPPRANVVGLYGVPQSLVWDSFKFGDKTTGTGPLVNRKLLTLSPSTAVSSASASNLTGASFLDITGPWR